MTQISLLLSIYWEVGVKNGGETLYKEYEFVLKSIRLSAVFRERFSYFFHTAQTKMPAC